MGLASQLTLKECNNMPFCIVTRKSSVTTSTHQEAVCGGVHCWLLCKPLLAAPLIQTVESHTCRRLLVAALHADHVGDSSCFQAVVLCFIVAVAAHVGLVAAGPNQLAPASMDNHVRAQYYTLCPQNTVSHIVSPEFQKICPHCPCAAHVCKVDIYTNGR